MLKEVPFGTKDYGGHIIPKRHKALTVKKIEVEPYKWLEELDETVDQDGEIFSLRALTEKLSVQQGSNEQLKALKDSSVSYVNEGRGENNKGIRFKGNVKHLDDILKNNNIDYTELTVTSPNKFNSEISFIN